MALPAATVGAAAEATGSSAGSLFSQMALASMAGRAMAGTTGGGGAGRQERIGVLGRKPKDAATGRGSRSAADSGGRPDHEHRRRATGAGLAARRGDSDQEEFIEQKQRLLPRDP